MNLVRSLMPVVLGLAGCVVGGVGPARAAADPADAVRGYFAARDEARFGARATEVRTRTRATPGGDACPASAPRGRSFRVTVATVLTWPAGAAGTSSLADDYEVCLDRHVRAVRAAPESGYGGTSAPAPAGAGGTHRYDPAAAARYALRWSDTVVRDGEPVPRYHPGYPRLADDSANFVSQALEAGGWSRSAPVWAPGGPAWTRADGLYRFAVAQRAHPWGRSTPHSADIWRMVPGDLLFADWTSDGTIDHALVVVGLDTVLGFTEPTVSQHSPHRHNLPLSVAIKIAALGHGDMSFYPVTPHATYRERATT